MLSLGVVLGHPYVGDGADLGVGRLDVGVEEAERLLRLAAEGAAVLEQSAADQLVRGAVIVLTLDLHQPNPWQRHVVLDEVDRQRLVHPPVRLRQLDMQIEPACVMQMSPHAGQPLDTHSNG